MATNIAGGGVQGAQGAAEAGSPPGAQGAAGGAQESEILGAFLRGLLDDAIPALYRYLKDQAPSHPELGQAVGVLTEASRRYQQDDPGNAFWLVYAAYRFIALLRKQKPDLPELKLRPA